MKMKNPVRLAILDMNNNQDNLGIASIKRIADRFAIVDYDVFDVRHAHEVPGMDYDIYISSGGPGDPLLHEGGWESKYYPLMKALWDHNLEHDEKKFAFFICHSFQMICNHLKLGEITERKKESFGIVPVDKTEAGKDEPLFMALNSPFYAADFRKFQVVGPDHSRLEDLGATIMAVEEPDMRMEETQAVMAIRFSNEWFGTQFHPEAHPDGMIHYLRRQEKKEMILNQWGQHTYEEMMHNAIHPERLTSTRDHVLPGFIRDAIDQILSYSNSSPLVFQ